MTLASEKQALKHSDATATFSSTADTNNNSSKQSNDKDKQTSSKSKLMMKKTMKVAPSVSSLPLSRPALSSSSSASSGNYTDVSVAEHFRTEKSRYSSLANLKDEGELGSVRRKGKGKCCIFSGVLAVFLVGGVCAALAVSHATGPSLLSSSPPPPPPPPSSSSSSSSSSSPASDPLQQEMPFTFVSDPTCQNTMVSGTYTWNITSDGVRSYELYVPQGIPANTRVPMVVLLHGYTGTPELIENAVRMKAVLDDKKWIGVYPLGEGLIANSWNGAGCCPGAYHKDTDFLKGITTAISAAMCVDTDNVFAAGFSNGAFMTHRLACEAGLNAQGKPLFKAYVTHSGLLGLDFPCTPQYKVPSLSFHGTADDVVSFEGYAASLLKDPNKVYNSFFETAQFWERHNGCEPGASGVTVTVSDTTTCKYHVTCGGVPLKYCWITGDLKHHWSGQAGFGEPGVDIDATATMFAYFSHLLPVDSAAWVTSS